MQDDLHEISLDEMFKTYLNSTSGGEPTNKDLDAFTYNEEVETVTRAVDLRSKICAMGNSVAERTGNSVLCRDISESARQKHSTEASNGRKRSLDYYKNSFDREHSRNSRIHGATPDIAIYPNHNSSRLNTFTASGTAEYKEDEFKRHPNQVMSLTWSSVLSFIDVETDRDCTAFEFNIDSPDSPDSSIVSNDSDEGEKSLHKFLDVIRRIFAHQHRTHLFAVYVFRNQARIVYADRSGAVVSEPFRYGTRVHPTLHIFFWKLAHMSDKERGFDETVTLAADADVAAMREYAATAPTEYLRTQAYRALSSDPKAKEGILALKNHG